MQYSPQPLYCKLNTIKSFSSYRPLLTWCGFRKDYQFETSIHRKHLHWLRISGNTDLWMGFNNCFTLWEIGMRVSVKIWRSTTSPKLRALKHIHTRTDTHTHTHALTHTHTLTLIHFLSLTHTRAEISWRTNNFSEWFRELTAASPTPARCLSPTCLNVQRFYMDYHLNYLL